MVKVKVMCFVFLVLFFSNLTGKHSQSAFLQTQFPRRPTTAVVSLCQPLQSSSSSRFDQDHLPEGVKHLHVEVWFLGQILFLSHSLVVALLSRRLCFGWQVSLNLDLEMNGWKEWLRCFAW
ncbi:uncharacterized protein LOC124667157 [Lolium rigidum]|uniref:uncharacterized protein LOC124667157 n=1 Tax=Lolium rigidum TaxID=89674 RepID=UPI001F5E25B0|nr:uncharacterized protein LOC124667157 [Lolium rigidum]